MLLNKNKGAERKKKHKRNTGRTEEAEGSRINHKEPGIFTPRARKNRRYIREGREQD